MEKNHVLLIDRNPEIHKKLKIRISKLSLIAKNTDLTPVGYKDIDYHYVIGIPNFDTKNYINAAQFIYSLCPFNYVISFNDKYQELAASVAMAMGISFAYESGVCDTIRNKAEMRSKLKSLGLDSTAYSIVENRKDIKEFISQNNLPIILKPISGQGSVSVTVINHEFDIKKGLDRFEKHSPTETKYVEKFIKGKEYSVECFSENGIHNLICIVEKFKDEIHCIGQGHRIPAKLTLEIIETIKNFVFACLDGLSVKNGPTHTEIILDGKEPVIIESHTRVAGAHIPLIIEELYGIDIADLWVQMILGNSVINQLASAKYNGKSGVIWFKAPKKDGRLVRIEGLKETFSIEGVYDINIKKKEGEYIQKVAPRSEDRVVSIIVFDEDPENALTNAQKASKCLEIIVE